MVNDGHFIDLHCHILPGVDDGAVSIDEALEMLQIARADGIRSIVATPHVPSPTGDRVDPGKVRHAVDSLNLRARERGIDIQVLTGSEIRVEPGLVGRLDRGEILSLNNGPYVLLELPFVGSWPDYVRPAIYELQIAGYIPILAHAERYSGVQHDHRILHELIASGVLIQVNAGSLVRNGNDQPNVTSLVLVRARMVHVIATDAHSSTIRAPRIRLALARAAREAGHEYADWIASVSENVILGKSVNIPEPVSPSTSSLRSRLSRWRRIIP